MNDICVWYITHSFTKLSLNVCIINTHILIYWYARCNCKLWKGIWFYCVFSFFFVHNWRIFMSEVLYLQQTFIECVSNQYIHFNVSTCQIWLQVMEHHLILPCFFFGEFSQLVEIHKCLKCCIIAKLLQFVYLHNSIKFMFFQFMWLARCVCFFLPNPIQLIESKENKFEEICFLFITFSPNMRCQIKYYLNFEYD